MNYEETMQWVEQSQAEREAEHEAFTKRVAETKAKNAEQMMRLDVVSERLNKIRHQLDSLKTEVNEYEAKMA